MRWTYSGRWGAAVVLPQPVLIRPLLYSYVPAHTCARRCEGTWGDDSELIVSLGTLDYLGLVCVNVWVCCKCVAMLRTW